MKLFTLPGSGTISTLMAIGGKYGTIFCDKLQDGSAVVNYPADIVYNEPND